MPSSSWRYAGPSSRVQLSRLRAVSTPARLPTRPRVLYVSPAVPRSDGRGLERRAYRVIEALSYRCRVSLLTIARSESAGRVPSDVLSMCESVTVLPAARWTAGLPRRALRRFLPDQHHAWYRQPSDWYVPSGADRRRLGRMFAGDRFDFVHLHRLYMLPLLLSCPTLKHLPACLDLDDVESLTRDRLADLARRNGDETYAHRMERDADAYRAIEHRELWRFDRIYVCSETDRARLLGGAGSQRVDVLPNVVVEPASEPPTRARHTPADRFVFLFVGTLGYYPNRDAVAYFCRDVVPLIRRLVARPFEIRIVSDEPPSSRLALPGLPEVSWAPHDTDLRSEYAAAHAVIVPIRAGGARASRRSKHLCIVPRSSPPPSAWKASASNMAGTRWSEIHPQSLRGMRQRS